MVTLAKPCRHSAMQMEMVPDSRTTKDAWRHMDSFQMLLLPVSQQGQDQGSIVKRLGRRQKRQLLQEILLVITFAA